MHAMWSKVIVHGCVVLLGINSLISANGLWMELPIMIYELPEGWALASYLTAVIQMANIAPIIYGIIVVLLRGKFTEKYWIYAMLVNGFFSAIVMGFFWDTTVIMNGKERSIPLFVLTFFLAVVDSLSSVVCLPFMAFLKPIYVNSYMIGEGLSGLLPSVAALIQGIDENTGCRNVTRIVYSKEDNQNYTVFLQEPNPIQGLRFTVTSFFYFLGAMMAFSLFGFVILCHNKLARTEYVEECSKDHNTISQKEELLLKNSSETKTIDKLTSSHQDNGVSCAADVSLTERGDEVIANKKRAKNDYFILLAMQAWISCLSLGALPSIQSYSCAPYGPLPFHFAVLLSSLANPVAGFIAIWVPLKSLRKLTLLIGLGTAMATYLMVLAVMSPNPPMVNTIHGSVIMVSGWIVFTSIFGYGKVAVASLLWNVGHKALFWCGVMTQVGATIGAIVLFIFVNVLEYFADDGQC